MNFSDAFVAHCPEMVKGVYKPIREMQDEIEDFAQRSQVLSGDIQACNTPLQEDGNNQFWRRTLVRNLFALIEGCAYGFKRAALHRHRHFVIDFSPAELAMLAEEKFYLDDKGEAIRAKDNYQKMVPNLRFAFRSFAKSVGLQFELSMSNSPLPTCEKLRNRITHPKRLADLTITDEETQLIGELWKWFEGEFIRIMDAVIKVGGSSLPVRAPQVKVSQRYKISGRFIVFLQDGSLYQFDDKKDAEALVKANSKQGELPPVMFPTSEFLLLREEDF